MTSGQGEAAGRGDMLVDRMHEIHEMVEQFDTGTGPNTTVALVQKCLDRIAELERVVDAECEQKYKLLAETVDQSARIAQLEAANLQRTEERDRLRAFAGRFPGPKLVGYEAAMQYWRCESCGKNLWSKTKSGHAPDCNYVHAQAALEAEP